MGVADRRDAQNGDADRSDDEANHRRDHIFSCKLAQMHRKNQISRAKEHTK